jgi:hypothetical protein
MDGHPGISDLMPKDGIPIASIRGVIYLAPDGGERFAWQAGQDASLATTSGLLNVIQRAMLNEALTPVEGDD